MKRAASPFSPAAVAAILLVGGGAFLLFLYAIGAGWTGDRMRVTAHANSNALDGYSALVDLLDRRGFTVSTTRQQSAQEDYGTVLVLTPGFNTDPALVAETIAARRYVGPTIVILPKWSSTPLPDNAPEEAGDDWVELSPAWLDLWFESVEDFEPLAIGHGGTEGWQGMGLAGDLPDNSVVQAITELPGKELFPLISDAEGDLLAGYWNRGGYHPALADAAGIAFNPDEEDSQDADIYPLVLIAEPDLMNNYGMADRTRAMAAVALVEIAMEDSDLAVVFDLTMPGFGSTENLLTLAFRPPFLAATLCLLLAMLLVGWRAFFRFGPPVAEVSELAHGKTQLARNAANLVERARRWRLLGTPYAALVAARIAAALNIRETDTQLREAAIDTVLAARGLGGPGAGASARADAGADAGPDPGPGFAATATHLRNARRPAEIVRAAHALRSIERTLLK
ncbi:MAG TPA: DUF4350 domain-containing protein [Paracoccaceae bacterium]|nr:DUF4350 domain-containing protein [Paracoccaceae bacterium]